MVNTSLDAFTQLKKIFPQKSSAYFPAKRFLCYYYYFNYLPVLFSLCLSGGTVCDAPRPCWLMYLLWKDGWDDEEAAAQHPPDIFTSGRRSTSPQWDASRRIRPDISAVDVYDMFSQLAWGSSRSSGSFHLSLPLHICIIMFYMTSGWNRQCNLSTPSGQTANGSWKCAQRRKNIDWKRGKRSSQSPCMHKYCIVRKH